VSKSGSSRNEKACARFTAQFAKAAALSFGLIFALAKCSYDWNVPDPGELSQNGNDASSASDSKTVLDQSSDATAPSDADADAGDSSLPIVALDASCSQDVQCAEGSFCKYADEGCGSVQATGVCTMSAGCDGDGGAEVCACNGQVYPSQCAARKDGQDISLSGSCTAPSNAFRCGYAFCQTSEFCVDHTYADAGSAYSCASFDGCILGCGCAATKSACDAGACTGLLVGYEVTCH